MKPRATPTGPQSEPIIHHCLFARQVQNGTSLLGIEVYRRPKGIEAGLMVSVPSNGAYQSATAFVSNQTLRTFAEALMQGADAAEGGAA